MLHGCFQIKKELDSDEIKQKIVRYFFPGFDEKTFFGPSHTYTFDHEAGKHIYQLVYDKVVVESKFTKQELDALIIKRKNKCRESFGCFRSRVIKTLFDLMSYEVKALYLDKGCSRRFWKKIGISKVK